MISPLVQLKARSSAAKEEAYARKRDLDDELMRRDLAAFLDTRPDLAGRGSSGAGAYAFYRIVDGLETFLEIEDRRGILPFTWRWNIAHRACPDMAEAFIDHNRFINVPLIDEGSEPGLLEGIGTVIAKYEAFLAWEAELDRPAYREYFYRFEEERMAAEAESMVELFSVVEGNPRYFLRMK